MDYEWPDTGQGEVPDLPALEDLLPPVSRALRVNGSAVSRQQPSTDSPQPTRNFFAALLFLLLPLTVLSLVSRVWGQAHHLWARELWLGQQPLPALDFLAPGVLGRGFEILFWVTWSVQLRSIVKVIVADRRNSFSVRRSLMPWVLDTLYTPFVCWILISLLQGISFDLGGGLRLSLGNADYAPFSALSALLGMSVRETRALLARLTYGWFRRWRDSDPPLN